MAKLAALVPAPRAHLRTYHGILAPTAKWRPQIVPTPASNSAYVPTFPSQRNPQEVLRTQRSPPLRHERKITRGLTSSNACSKSTCLYVGDAARPRDRGNPGTQDGAENSKLPRPSIQAATARASPLRTLFPCRRPRLLIPSTRPSYGVPRSDNSS
jgi:hypothetical protein